MLRPTLRAVLRQESLGDISTLDDPTVSKEKRKARREQAKGI